MTAFVLKIDAPANRYEEEEHSKAKLEIHKAPDGYIRLPYYSSDQFEEWQTKLKQITKSYWDKKFQSKSS